METYKKTILEYIEKNQHNNIDMVDIVHQFMYMGGETVFIILDTLEKENKIQRVANGIRYRYEIPTPIFNSNF